MVNDGRVNLAFTNATRNDLGVLRAKIKNDNLFVQRFERGGFKPRFRRLCETKNLAKRFSLAQEEGMASLAVTPTPGLTCRVGQSAPAAQSAGGTP